MKKEEQNKIIIITYFIGVLGALVLNYFKSNNLLNSNIVSSVKISTIITLWWWFYFKIGWRINFLNKLLPKINLKGTWFGEYKSENLKTQEIYEGEIAVRVNQDFLSISIVTLTEKYKNYSYSEELKYDEKSDVYGLIYTYSQKENSQLDLEQRNGTSELKISKYRDTYKMEGEFWTILGTKGKLNVTKISSKVIDTFDEAQEIFKNKELIGVKK